MRDKRLRRWSAQSTALLAAATVAGFAITAQGNTTRKVPLNDSGIWVTSDADGLFGRVNKSVSAIDAVVPAEGLQADYTLDVLQDGSALIARDVTSGRLEPISASLGSALKDQAVDIAAGAITDMRGGTLAVLDPISGNVWAMRYDPADPISDLSAVASSSQPTAALRQTPTEGSSEVPASDMAVGVDGVVHAVAGDGTVLTLHPRGSGFAKPETSSGPSSLESVAVSAIGTLPVVLDALSGTVWLDGSSMSLGQPDAQAVLGSPVPSGQLPISTSTAIYLAAAGQAPVKLGPDVTGAPARPVVVRGCVFAAWAGSPGTLESSCDMTTVTPLALDRGGSLARPVFRVNRDDLVLNDLESGRIFDLDLLKSIDNWKQIQETEKPSHDVKVPTSQPRSSKKKPKAAPDSVGARAGRTQLIHVLDNDSDPLGHILSVTSVTQPSNPEASAVVSPDGQTVRYTLGPDGGNSDFTYTISNGVQTAEGTVKVEGVADGVNDQPQQRPIAAPMLSAAAGQTLPVQVLSNWRDFDGDPLSIAFAEVKDGPGQAVVTPEGAIEFSAPADAKAGRRTINYRVSDGSSTVGSHVEIDVLGADQTRARPAQAEPDAARGDVGTPIVLSPLANDVPGADPLAPDATLALADPVADGSGYTATTDLESGQVVVTADRPGTMFIGYQAAFGGSSPAKGTIRIDATASSAHEGPVAMPDETTVRGQESVLVDVLANDAAPSGALLTVVSATAAQRGQVQVSVIHGRWLRILPISAKPQKTLVVQYEVTDGRSAPVAGDVLVTQLPQLTNDPPITRSDTATVRAGDSVLVNVLDNDTTQSGGPLHLLADIPGAPAPGQLPMAEPSGGAGDSRASGSAFVAGNKVRFVAPRNVDAATTVVLDYVAINDAGEKADGRLQVTINPAPGPGNKDRAPTPSPVSGTVPAGGSVTVRIPASNTDPDGDSTTVVGLASAPALGRVTEIGPRSITYQAYPDSAGTESFSFAATDQYGEQGTSTVRIAVIPPGLPQTPVAVDDVLTAAPGATVTIMPLLNDLYSTSDSPVVLPLDQSNVKVPESARLDDAGKVVTLTAPAADAPPLEVQYEIRTSGGVSLPATISVAGQQGFQNPPRTFDQVAQVGEDGTATADLLRLAFDPDGDTSRLSILSTADSEAVIEGGKATFTAAKRPQVIPFVVEDESGAMSGSVVYVPAASSSGPYVKPDALIEVPENSSVTAPLADYLVNPSGQPLTLSARGGMWASPAAGVTVEESSRDALVVSGRRGYDGPAAVVVEVTEEGPSGPGTTYVLSIPVQVGPDTPVLRCPDDVYEVPQGGEPRTLDVASVCSVWAPTEEMRRSLTFSEAWVDQIPDVSLSGGGTGSLVIAASGAAQPNALGTIAITADGTQADPALLHVGVKPADPPQVSPISLSQMKQGDTRTIDITDHVQSPLRDKAITVVSARQLTGDDAVIDHDDATVSITPGATAHGAMSFAVTVSDVADTSRTDRQATGVISFTVFGVPGKPAPPSVRLPAVNSQADLSWREPESNGAPITSYEVDWKSGSTTSSVPSAVARGLDNGTVYNFRVRAINKAGPGPWSSWSEPYTPVGRPGAWSTYSASGTGKDGQLKLVFKVPPSGGDMSAVSVKVDDGGFQDLGEYPPEGTSGEVSKLMGVGDNGVTHQVTLRVCNELDYCSTSGVRSASAYGPIGPLSVSLATTTGRPTGLEVTAAADGSGRPVIVHVYTDTGQDWTFDASGPVTKTWSYDVGYSTVDRAYIEVTHDDAGRALPPSRSSGQVRTEEAPPVAVNAYDNYGTVTTPGHAMCLGNPGRPESMPTGTATQTFTVPTGVGRLNGAKVQIDPNSGATAHLTLSANGSARTATATPNGDTYFSFSDLAVNQGDTATLSITFSSTVGKLITVYTVGSPGGTFTATNTCSDGAPDVATSAGLRAVVSGLSR